MSAPTQFQIDEGYKQVKLNARQRAVDDVKALIESSKNVIGVQPYTIDDVIAQAKKFEAYYLDGIEAPTVPTGMSIVRATRGPT